MSESLTIQTKTCDNLNIFLEKFNITPTKIIHNPSYETLYTLETNPNLPSTDLTKLTKLDAVTIDTGKYTGRSPNDKYIVKHPNSENNIWWKSDQKNNLKNNSDNKSISQQTWQELKKLSCDQLNNKKLYIMDGYCGASKKTRLKVRLITEVAWQAHFFKNMFIRPSSCELEDFTPDWTILNSCKTKCKNYKNLGLNSETYVAFNIEEKTTLIGGTWYGGEMKKGIFSIMNYFLPMQDIGSFHCAANQGENGETYLFFGLSGTGKTTLSADPKRKLIGDDEHGWDDNGVFNLEGGCYAKTINLTHEAEPDIYNAIKRDALLENIVIDKNNNIDFSDSSKTPNSRVSYPLEHINKRVISGKGDHPNIIIFLTCDAFGVLPPVSKLNLKQASEQFLAGYTAKIAGTERGVTEPQAVFSSCFGKPFLLMHPKKYAQILENKIKKHNAKAYLVNTGWSGGPYGVGKRISLKNTRAIIDAILDHSIEKAPTEIFEKFGFEIPTELPGVNSEILNPKNTWENKHEYDNARDNLISLYEKNKNI